MSAVSVNGVVIPEAAIAREMQHHPARGPDEARAAAVQALAVRELLVQEARRVGLVAQPRDDGEGRRETEEEALVRQLVEREVTVPEADEAACRGYYERNRKRFRSPDIFEASHILFAADPADAPAYARAVERAAATIRELDESPERFAELARALSDCPSGRQGGSLGQVSRGQTVPEFETFLFGLDEGQLCPLPVKTRFGAHVLRLDRRIAGRELPFEQVRGRIAAYLAEHVWRRATHQYIAILAGRAKLSGVALDAARSTLVQ
jgi:peptidyl-prolyl cis-trans isomerase C